MIKRILIPLDPSPFTENALKFGTTMAKFNGAQITGLVILDIAGIEKSIGPIPLGGLYYADKIEETKQKEAQIRINQLLSKFKDTCEKAGVVCHEAQTQGIPSEQIIQESIFYDAVVMGMRTFFHFETQDTPGDSLEKVLDQTITPVYAVPENIILPDIPPERIKVLIAFDGSLCSARALQRFGQLAPMDVFEVKLLISETKEEKAHYYLNQAESYLRCHNINKIHKEWIKDEIIEAIDKKYLDWAHIVVVGAHSKTGLFKFMVGSLTKHLIKVAKRPLLIAQ